MDDDFLLSLGDDAYKRYAVSNDVVYVPARDGLWVYGMNKLWSGFQLSKDYGHDFNIAWVSCVSKEYCFVSYITGSRQAIERRYKIGNNKNPYTTAVWSLWSMIYDGGKWYKRKKKIIVWLDVGYDLSKTDWWSIKIYIRIDRSSYKRTAWWILVGEITDTTQHRYLQSPGISTNDALWKDFFQLEYRIELYRWSDQTGTPIVSEVAFTLWITENATK